jgi:hypothetical protein|tara:strand:- start:3157 stop:3300 length:144 start_codon:yes stop_codon:yes gene_type:complete
MKVKIEFIKDFATKKKGDIVSFDGQLASRLIKEKAAKLYNKKVSKKQ